jgi:hypothetical protein
MQLPFQYRRFEKLWNTCDERQARDDEKYGKGVQQNRWKPVKIIGQSTS